MRRALAVALAVTACATPSVDEQRSAEAEELARFSAALTLAGMSVPLPPRRCEEPRGAPRWDEDVGCLDGVVDDRRAALAVYARALVRERLGAKRELHAEARGDELAEAYLRRDERFASLALAIERDFDARRAAKSGKPAARPRDDAAKKDKPATGDKGAPASEHGAVDAGPSALDAGPALEAASVDAGAVAGDAGVPRTLREQLIGTWVVVAEGPVQNVYALCADGSATLRPETADAAIAELLGDLPPTRGTWEVSEGPPPKLAFVWGEERYEGEILELSAESLTIDYGEERVTATRRSASASCE